jgi:hypothetical protein
MVPHATLPAARTRPAVLAAVVAVLAVIGLAASPTAATAVAAERVEIVLEPAALPAADRVRHDDRRQAIADAIASGLPLWRSFEPREVLHDALAALAANGVDLGESAIVNFDSLEADVPDGARAALASLPFVREVRSPMVGTQAGTIDSEGLEAIGSDLANAGGITGVGVTVAVIDTDWKRLNATVQAGDLPAIPLSMQFKVAAAGNTNPTSGQSIHNLGDREHGTAAAEVVHEVAPGATLMLYQVGYLATGEFTAAAVKRAIRHAADQGAKVILVPLHFLSTMSDPNGVAQGGKNLFTDDITYAKAAGATVVVAAGNEGLRHYEGQFTPCTDCNTSVLCNTATNDSAFHIFDDTSPLNDLILDSDYDDFAFNTLGTSVKVICYSATDAATPSNFRMRLYRFHDDYNAPNPPDFPSCPSDAGATAVDGTDVPLGGSFAKTLTFYGDTFDDYYFLTVRRTSGTATPRFRVDCTVAIGELTFTTPERSLSDLAVVDDSLAVGAGGFPSYDGVLDISSWGPTANTSGPMKPDLIAPGEVSSFAVTDYGFVFSQTFNGTSAASAHVAGVVALLQSYQAMNGLAPFTPDQVKQILFASAIELDDGLAELAGPDPIYGHGLVQIPALLLPGGTPDKTRDDWDGDATADRATFAAGSGDWSWLGSTGRPGSLQAFGAGLRAVPGDYDGDGITDAAVYDETTGDWQFNGSSVTIPPEDLGGPGFLAVPCDWDGDGADDPAVYETATGDWTYQGSTSGPGEIAGFGGAGFEPIPGDWDGDGTCDPATYAAGQWSYLDSASSQVQFAFGGGGAGRFVPVPADYDGDGRMDAALYQKKKGKWRLRFSSLGGYVQSFTGFGGAGFVAVPADFDADGKIDPAIYRKSNGNWRYKSSDTGEFVTLGPLGGPGLQAVVGMRP